MQLYVWYGATEIERKKKAYIIGGEDESALCAAVLRKERVANAGKITYGALSKTTIR
jgi:hypothetical protein